MTCQNDLIPDVRFASPPKCTREATHRMTTAIYPRGDATWPNGVMRPVVCARHAAGLAHFGVHVIRLTDAPSTHEEESR